MTLKKLVLPFLLALIFVNCKSSVASKEILFICPHGAARSPIAAAYFNEMAKAQNLNYHAVFRGTEPDETLSARTIEGLTADGIDIKGWKPELVSTEDIDKAFTIVTFDCTVPTAHSSALEEQWNGTPSPSKEFEAFRALTQDKVKALIDKLPKN